MYKIAQNTFGIHKCRPTPIPSFLSFYRFMSELKSIMSPMLAVLFVIILAGLCMSAFSFVTVCTVQEMSRCSFVALSGIVVIVLPLDQRFTGSNTAEDDVYLRAIQTVARLPSEGK
jgi:hypothetical protein